MLEKLKNKIDYLINKNLQDRKAKKFYSRWIKKNDLVFDVGANRGTRTNIFLNLKAKVVAVEPNPKLATRLTSKFGKKINLVQKAIGDKNGTIDLYINNTDTLSTISTSWIDSVQKSARFGNLGNQFNDKVEVEMTTINDLINIYKAPKFAKIDVEGVELSILKTIKDTKIENISFEFAIPESLDDTLSAIMHLHNIGYDFFNISFGESMELLTNENIDFKQISNLLQNLPPMSWGDIYVSSADI